MTQPTERRFVMEPRLDAEVEAINADKISHGTVVNSDVATGAAIDKTKIAGTAITAADTGTVTSTIIADGTIQSTDLDVLDYVKFDTTYTGGSTQPGMINWNDVDGTLEFQLKGGNVTLQLGQEQVVRVRNNTGSVLNNGKAVYISGSDGNNLRIAYANAGAENTSSGTIGVLTEDISNGQAGYVTTFGLVRDINTSALTEGAPVWLSTTNGVLTATRPTAPNHSVMVGFCLRAHAVNGSVFVRVDNGWELDELHNVLITSPTNGQALAYDSATGLWKNATPASTLNDLTDVTINSGTLAGGQVIKYDAGTTQWVNGAAAGGVTASATAPNLATSAAGDAWFDTNDGTLYVCYVDTDSTKQWVQVQANSALEASILSRLGALESTSVAFGALSPNYIINGAFEVNQRAFTSTTGSGFTFDRWSVASSSGTVTYSNQTFSPGAAPSSTVAGKNYLRCVTTGQSGASAYAIFAQAIEGVETLAGETVTVSFWAKAASGTPKIALEMYRSYGSGGSPSADEQFYAGQATLSTSMQRYSITYTLPSISGKTLGTTHTGYLKPQFWVSAGTDFNARTGSLGIQSNTFDIWGIQVERGTTATSFRRNANSIQGELAACQRYYWRPTNSNIYSVYGTGNGNPGGTAASIRVQMPATMRTTPTSIEYSSLFLWDNVNTPGLTSLAIATSFSNSTSVQLDAVSTGLTGGRTYSLINQANAAGYLGINAEL